MQLRLLPNKAVPMVIRVALQPFWACLMTLLPGPCHSATLVQVAEQLLAQHTQQRWRLDQALTWLQRRLTQRTCLPGRVRAAALAAKVARLRLLPSHRSLATSPGTCQEEQVHIGLTRCTLSGLCHAQTRQLSSKHERHTAASRLRQLYSTHSQSEKMR